MRRLIATLFLLLCSIAPTAAFAQATPNCAAVNPSGGQEQFQVFFATGSAGFDAAARRELARAAARIKGRFAAEVCLIGRASRVGNVAANQRLSQQRISAVRAELVRQGVTANVLGSAAQGATFERAHGGANSRDERQVSIVIMR